MLKDWLVEKTRRDDAVTLSRLVDGTVAPADVPIGMAAKSQLASHFQQLQERKGRAAHAEVATPPAPPAPPAPAPETVTTEAPKKKARKEQKKKEPSGEPEHPFYSDTIVYCGNIKTRVIGIPVKKDGDYMYELEGFTKAQHQSTVFFTPPRGKTMTPDEAKKLKESRKKK